MKNSETNNIQSHSGNTVLCDGFLIPMTDFVLRINEIEKEIDQFFDSWRMKQLRIIENYAKFLKQPLKMELFYPCDTQGNFIKKPELNKTLEPFSYERFSFAEKERIYNEAKQKIVFEDTNHSVAFIQDYIKSKNSVENYVNAIVGRGKFLKFNENGLNAIFG